jgi:hypothetical protein
MLEFPTGVQRGEDHFERALLRLRVFVDRNAAPVITDRDRRLIVMQRDVDVRGIAVHGFIDGVVEDLPDQMVQSGRADAPDVHAGTLANRLETFENGDVFGGIARCHSSDDST